MLCRCSEAANLRRDYKYYGGKGVTVCEEWRDFDAFAEWALSNGYSDKLTLDRIDGRKNYSPENCRWITLEEQQRNKSNNRKYTYNGKTQTLAEWARECGINRSTLGDRMDKFGFTFEEAISRPINVPRTTKLVEYNGEFYTVGQLEEMSGVPRRVIRWRIRKCGWSVEDAMNTPYAVSSKSYRKK